MPVAIDVTNPADDGIVSVYPANERAHRTNLDDIISVEHDVVSGRHAFGSGTSVTRDGITNWQTGSLWFNTDYSVSERYNGASWEPVGVASGSSAERLAATNMPTGLVWIETNTNWIYSYTGSAWVRTAPPLLDVEQKVTSVQTSVTSTTAATPTVMEESSGVDMQIDLTPDSVLKYLNIQMSGQANVGSNDNGFVGIRVTADPGGGGETEYFYWANQIGKGGSTGGLTTPIGISIVHNVLLADAGNVHRVEVVGFKAGAGQNLVFGTLSGSTTNSYLRAGILDGTVT